MNVGNHGVGVYDFILDVGGDGMRSLNVMADIGNDGTGSRDIVTNGRNGYVCVQRKFGLGTNG